MARVAVVCWHSTDTEDGVNTLKRVANAGRLLSEVSVRLRLWWRLIIDPRVPETLKLLLPAIAIVYLLWPADLLTDIIPLVGQIDDVGLLLLAMSLFESLAPRQVVEEHLSQLRRPRVHQQPKQPEGDVIDGEYRLL